MHTSGFFEIFGPSGAKYREKGLAALKVGKGWSTNHFGVFYLSGQTRFFVILGLICIVLNKICCHSSFTGLVDLIIGSSRSGTCFSSCLTSSTCFSVTKKFLFLEVLFPGPSPTTPSNTFLDPAIYLHLWWESLYLHLWCGLINYFHKASLSLAVFYVFGPR